MKILLKRVLHRDRSSSHEREDKSDARGYANRMPPNPFRRSPHRPAAEVRPKLANPTISSRVGPTRSAICSESFQDEALQSKVALSLGSGCPTHATAQTAVGYQHCHAVGEESLILWRHQKPCDTICDERRDVPDLR